MKLTQVILTIYVDASDACVARVIATANGIPIMSYWNNQHVAECASYGTEIAARSIAVQFAIAYHFSFWMLGFKIDGQV